MSTASYKSSHLVNYDLSEPTMLLCDVGSPSGVHIYLRHPDQTIALQCFARTPPHYRSSVASASVSFVYVVASLAMSAASYHPNVFAYGVKTAVDTILTVHVRQS